MILLWKVDNLYGVKEQQQAFDKIKRRLVKPLVLHLPDNKGRFHLYSDTSKVATGSALYHIQNGKQWLIVHQWYFSKTEKFWLKRQAFTG